MDLRDRIIEHIDSENIAPMTRMLFINAIERIESSAKIEGELLAKVNMLKLELREAEQRNQDLLGIRNALQMKLEAVRHCL